MNDPIEVMKEQTIESQRLAPKNNSEMFRQIIEFLKKALIQVHTGQNILYVCQFCRRVFRYFYLTISSFRLLIN